MDELARLESSVQCEASMMMSDDDMSDDEPEPAAAAPSPEKPGGVSCEKKSIMAQLADCKSKIANYQELKKERLEEEDFVGAQKLKQSIQEQEQRMQELRRAMNAAPTPSRAKVVPPPAAAAVPRDLAAAADSATSAATAAVAVATNQTPAGTADAVMAPPDVARDVEMEAADVSTLVAQPDAKEASTSAAASRPPPPPGFTDVMGSGFLLADDVSDRLYSYQREGVAWMAGLWKAESGGILADEMGLGKTVQVCAFLNGVRKQGATHALLLLPVTLLDHWKQEAQRWCPGWPVYIYQGTPQRRAKALRRVSRPQGGLLLASYALLGNTDQLFEVKVADPNAKIPRKCPRRPAAAVAEPDSGTKRRGRPAAAAADPDGGTKRRGRPAATAAASDGGAKRRGRPTAAAADPDGGAKRSGRPAKRVKLEGGREKDGEGAEANEDSGDEDDQQEAEIPAEGDLAKPGETKLWDIVVCDEAHRMKNISTLLGKSLRKLRSKSRFLLTGTPVQNALQDLWAIMDFAQPGLLGNHATFVKRFSEPIDRGSFAGADPFAVELKKHLTDVLKKLMAPYLLRRTKTEVGLIDGAGPAGSGQDDACDAAMEEFAAEGAELQSLKPKRETIVWLEPSTEQIDIYRKILERSEIIKEAANKAKLGIEVFQAIGLLKRICNHPLLGISTAKKGQWTELLSEAMAAPELLAGDVEAEKSGGSNSGTPGPPEGSALAELGTGADVDTEHVRAGLAAERHIRRLPRSADDLLAQSAKLRCLGSMLPDLAARGHRTLIFCQSVKMLDLVQICVLKPHGLRCLRIDGQTDPCVRAEKVAKFQKHTDRFQCMLMTTAVGGVGLNLTSADRVIIVDPAWNPATDAQAVDRAFRIGQEKEVRVYRLVMSGLIEDKMFRLQVFKMGLAKTALDSENKSQRYFTSKEIKALFEWTDPMEGETRKLLIEKSGTAPHQEIQRFAEEDGAAEDGGWLNEESLTVGVSDFSCLFGSLTGGTKQAKPDEPEEDECAKKIAETKQKFTDVEEKAKEASAARLAAEALREALAKEIEESAGAIAGKTAGRIGAEDVLKSSRMLLAVVRKKETLATQHLEKAAKARLKAVNEQLRVLGAASQTAAAAGAATAAATEAGAALRAAEEALSQAFLDAEGVFALVDEDGVAATKNDVVDANPALQKKAWRSLEKVRRELDMVASHQAQLEFAQEDLAKMEEEKADEVVKQLLASVEGGSGEQSSGSGGSPVSAKATKAAILAAKNRDRDWQRVEQAHERAQARVDAAREAVSTAVSVLAEAGQAFVDSFQKTSRRSVKAEEVHAVKKPSKVAFRELSYAWQTSRKTQESWWKATVVSRKATRKAAGAAKSLVEADKALSIVDRDYQEAAEVEAARRAEREAAEESVKGTEAACKEAETSEAQLKKRREELKAQLVAAREAIRPARIAEKEAAAERQALARTCSKVERAHSQMELAKNTAVQHLKGEAYDADQVNKAYDQHQTYLMRMKSTASADASTEDSPSKR
eukprot:gnl/TRDRNA2_/TRDRNA2_84195_c0_seq1.p1 gnl/TRDRNA2_/TRDRNA2_84195_c0~~gnl/TRDRNA2_/TRDRNA2_84195_c0_seq1.p1  ORF type:complete len:1510 (+),score=417.13 gnl/TRDRNA2_/TRDRNA2_84195_c0_seq1:75-4604(+)